VLRLSNSAIDSPRADPTRRLPGGAGMGQSRMDRSGWHTTRPFRAHGWRFSVRSSDPEVTRVFDQAFTDLACDVPPRHIYRVVPRGDRWATSLGAESFGRLPTLGEAVGVILGHVNRQVVRMASQRLVVFHAACAELDGIGVVLSGAMEAGKTTTVAGLLREGFAYLTDEAIGLDPESLLLYGYPKPLSIEPGSWEALADLAPAAPELFRMQWHVPGSQAGPGGCAEVTRAGVVVSLRYESGSATTMQPVGRADMLIELAQSTFRLEAKPRRYLTATAAMLRQSDTYRLQIGSLDLAVRAISEAVDRRRSGS
jgi:hypothetical protein